MNATPKPRKTKQQAAPPAEKPKPKPNIPPLDEVAALREAARLAQEGNAKLAKAIDTLRSGLQVISVAEWDHETNLSVSPSKLRQMAAETLSAAGQLAGQNWLIPRNQVVHSRAGRADHDMSKNRNLDGEDYD